MINKKWNSQINKVPVFPDPRRRKRMWEHHVMGKTLDGGVIVEFGVADGGSIGWFTKKFPDTTVFGFDSFEGLPEDWMVEERVILPKGHFNRNGQPPRYELTGGVTYVKGWFEDTLPDWNKNFKGFIKIAHIDSDLYSSCKIVLENIKDKLRVGSFILFDEITHLDGRDHELKAFVEFCNANPSFDFDVIARTTGPQAMIKVLSI
tara:strand:- start:2995 stop:3609 length:615 start_codon:yes stop_codon:yes gene_type:complete